MRLARPGSFGHIQIGASPKWLQVGSWMTHGKSILIETNRIPRAAHGVWQKSGTNERKAAGFSTNDLHAADNFCVHLA